MRQTRVLAAASIAALLAACAPKAVKKTSDQQNLASQQPAASPVPSSNVEATEASLRGAEFQKIDGVDPIYFEYDSSTLKDDALATLKKNAAYLKENSQLEVEVAGFCDERGTVAYNLALGQKRAKSVREYYIRLGVAAKSIATISYGKEQPVCGESTEDCWSKNRRAETRVRSRATVDNAATPAP